MNLTANYPTNVGLKEKIIWFEFIHSRNMITLDINDTNMEFKQIITIINKIPNDFINIKSKVIKQGVMHFFSHSCLLFQSIYNSKPTDCVIIIFVDIFAKISLFFNFVPVYDNTYNIIKHHSGFSFYHVDSRIIFASIVSYEDGLKGIMICDRFLGLVRFFVGNISVK